MNISSIKSTIISQTDINKMKESITYRKQNAIQEVIKIQKENTNLYKKLNTNQGAMSTLQEKKKSLPPFVFKNLKLKRENPVIATISTTSKY